MRFRIEVKVTVLVAIGASLAFSKIESQVVERFPGQKAYPHFTFRAYPLLWISPELSITAEQEPHLPFEEQLLLKQTYEQLGLDNRRQAKVEFLVDEFRLQRWEQKLSSKNESII